ncbi:MAG: type II toxin-antitoxin system RelE/ParE family toxin [Planctomycetota bacterium]
MRYFDSLEPYLDFIASRSPKNAAIVGDAIAAAVKLLPENPTLGSVFDDDLPDHRKLIVKETTVVYYRVTDEIVELLEVAHVRLNRDTLRFD